MKDLKPFSRPLELVVGGNPLVTEPASGGTQQDAYWNRSRVTSALEGRRFIGRKYHKTTPKARVNRFVAEVGRGIEEYLVWGSVMLALTSSK